MLKGHLNGNLINKKIKINLFSAKCDMLTF